MQIFPVKPPKIKSNITPQMCTAIVPQLVKRFTIDTIATNPDSFSVYAGTKATDGGCLDKIKNNNSAEDLATQLTENNLIDHGAIRSIRDLASDNIALHGVDPYIERWEALGFVVRSPFDTYPFKDRGVMGLHMELHPDLVVACGLNMGKTHDIRYFKWFLSEQSSGFIPESLRHDVVGLLNKAQDPMTPKQLKLLDRVKDGENLKATEIDDFVSGIYNFMTKPFAEVPKELRQKMQEQLDSDKQNYKIIEYFYSGLFSKINHVAYVSQNARKLFEIMTAAKLDLTDFQGTEPLQQFGANAARIEDKWGEFIQRSVLKNTAGQLIDHNGEVSEKEYVKRNFEFKNADNLFPAGIPKK